MSTWHPKRTNPNSSFNCYDSAIMNIILDFMGTRFRHFSTFFGFCRYNTKPHRVFSVMNEIMCSTHRPLVFLTISTSLQCLLSFFNVNTNVLNDVYCLKTVISWEMRCCCCRWLLVLFVSVYLTSWELRLIWVFFFLQEGSF